MRKFFIVLLTIILSYLIQGNILNHFHIFGIAPNIFIAIIAISSVAFSRVAVFGISATIGILLESMLTTLPFISVVFYPAFGFLSAILFGDKSERKLEEELAADKQRKSFSPYLRTIFSSIFISAVFETMHLAYMYLAGSEMSIVMFLRSAWSLLYTLGVTFILMVPLRYIFGINKTRRATRKSRY